MCVSVCLQHRKINKQSPRGSRTGVAAAASRGALAIIHTQHTQHTHSTHTHTHEQCKKLPLAALINSFRLQLDSQFHFDFSYRIFAPSLPATAAHTHLAHTLAHLHTHERMAGQERGTTTQATQHTEATQRQRVSVTDLTPQESRWPVEGLPKHPM